MNKLMMVYLYNKKNRILINATKWLNIIIFVLSERSQMQKSTSCMIPFLMSYWRKQNYRKTNQVGVAKGLGVGKEIDCRGE